MVAPPVGLDPKSARIVKELFKQKAEEGSTVFLFTHSLEIAEELCQRENQDIDLEEIFLELTGAWEMQQVIAALKEE